MAKRNPIQSALEKLSKAREDPRSKLSRSLLLEALEDGEGLVAAKAAGIVAEVGCGPERGDDEFDPSHRDEVLDDGWVMGFMPPMMVAFDRLLGSPERDRGVPGKYGVLRALNRMGCGEAELFLRGAGCRQLDPAFNGAEERAAPVRVEGLLGLVRLRYPGRYRVMADMLWDDRMEARVGAVRAAVYDDSEVSGALLRAKGLGGDKGEDDPVKERELDGGVVVMGELFTGLLLLERAEGVEYVSRFVGDKCLTGVVRDQASMALGGSRLEEGLRSLGRMWEGCVEFDERARVMSGVALNGSDEAMEMLRGWVAEGGEGVGERYKEVLEWVWGEGSPRLRGFDFS